MKIKITLGHIALGRIDPHDQRQCLRSLECPLARAIFEQTGQTWAVGRTQLHPVHPHSAPARPLPPAALAFVRLADEHPDQLTPCELELPLP